VGKRGTGKEGEWSERKGGGGRVRKVMCLTRKEGSEGVKEDGLLDMGDSRKESEKERVKGGDMAMKGERESEL
jgi:hypothetical protein